jgi:hypothetical protein
MIVVAHREDRKLHQSLALAVVRMVVRDQPRSLPAVVRVVYVAAPWVWARLDQCASSTGYSNDFSHDHPYDRVTLRQLLSIGFPIVHVIE